MNVKKKSLFPGWLIQGNVWENLALVIMAFYPLRHINWGLDLWDTGYNYANFQYFETEHMDPMWLFSTYLANVTGNMLTRLPNGDTLMGMNLYTGLFVSAMALTGYFFCTRKLKMPKILTFLGEMLAISLCWCPTALLYNYLTYTLFLISSVFLYLGLTKDKKAWLVLAGILLGTNVFVRFSNLPEAGMIAAVWAYDFILWRQMSFKAQETAGGSSSEAGVIKGKTRNADLKDRDLKEGNPKDRNREIKKLKAMEENADRIGEGFWRRIFRHTLWCLLGYAAALAVLLNYIHICYGLENYIQGIERLFAMTDKAVDYKPAAMIMGVVGTYVTNLYWVVRIGIIVIGGMVFFAAADLLERLCMRLWRRKDSKHAGHLKKDGRFGQAENNRFFEKSGWTSELVLFGRSWRELPILVRALHIGIHVCWMLVSAAMLWWLYKSKFCSLLFYSYDSMLRPGILFLMLTMLIAAVRIFAVSSPVEEKLISGMLILIILLTSLGSNNDVYPSLNNLFLAAPYTLWQSRRFLRHGGNGRAEMKIVLKKKGSTEKQREDRDVKGLLLASFPAKGILAAFLGLCCFQFAGFGAGFVFAEATGVQEASISVDNNSILRNIRMSPEKAEWVGEISAFVNENGLEGQEVILYGNIPALSYYLQMPAAFNPWCDLDSYGFEVMEKDLARLAGLIREKGKEAPVIIVENKYVLYEEEGLTALEAAGVPEENRQKMADDPKWPALVEFMETFGYEQTFHNEKFTLYQSVYEQSVN